MLAVSPAFELTGAEEKGLQGVFINIVCNRLYSKLSFRPSFLFWGKGPVAFPVKCRAYKPYTVYPNVGFLQGLLQGSLPSIPAG